MSRDLEIFFKNLRELLDHSGHLETVLRLAMERTEQDIAYAESTEDLLSLDEVDAGQS